MDAGEVIPLQNEILLVLLILGGILVIVFILINYLQITIPKALKKFPQDFNHIQAEVKSILLATQAYSPDDPQPYGPIMAKVNRDLDAIANQLVQVKNHYIDIQHRLHNLSLKKWQMIIAAPIYLYPWLGLQKETSQVQQEIVDLEGLVNNAWSMVKDLDRQVWLLAQRSRAVIAQQQEIRRLMDDLGDQKLYGDTFDQTAEKEDHVIEALENIPEYFLLADENSISDNATKPDVYNVNIILSEVEPVLEELQNNLSAWASGYEKLAEMAASDRQQLEHVEQLMYSAPDGMLVDIQKNQIAVLWDTLRVLTDTLSRLEVESFTPVELELERVLNVSTEIGNQLRRGFRNFASLKYKVEKLAELQSECSELFSNLLKASIYPVIWDRSQNEFMELNKRITELGTHSKPRTLENIEQDLAQAEELLVRLNTLHDHLHEIDKRHEELLILFHSVEIQKRNDRFESYYHLGVQIKKFHPDNWSKTDLAESYVEDVNKLDSQHKEFLERDPSQCISESEIDLWLKKAGNLVQDHKSLWIRSEKIQARLQFIQTTESSAKDQFDTAQKAFTQIRWLANSNLLLKKIADKDLDRISRELDQCRQQLGQSHTGLVEKKSRMVQAVFDNIEAAGNRWLERLNQDIDERTAVLAEKIEVLQEIATLEDPAIEKIQRLLAREERVNLHMQTIPSFHMSLDDIVSELKGRSIVWQELGAAQQELEEIVETPLIDAYNNAESKRERALDSLKVASQIIPEQRKWPPCTVSIADERKELADLDVHRNSLKSQKTRAIWAVRQYSELAANYQTLTERIERTGQWASQEQKRIQDLESEIDRLNRLWHRQEQMNENDPEAVEQIRKMRAQANLSVEQQRQSWESASPATADPSTYESILQALMDVIRTLRSSTIRVRSDRGMSRDIQLNSTPQYGESQDEKI